MAHLLVSAWPKGIKYLNNSEEEVKITLEDKTWIKHRWLSMSVQCPLKQVFRGQKEDMKLNVKKELFHKRKKCLRRTIQLIKISSGWKKKTSITGERHPWQEPSLNVIPAILNFHKTQEAGTSGEVIFLFCFLGGVALHLSPLHVANGQKSCCCPDKYTLCILQLMKHLLYFHFSWGSTQQ